MSDERASLIHLVGAAIAQALHPGWSLRHEGGTRWQVIVEGDRRTWAPTGLTYEIYLDVENQQLTVTRDNSDAGPLRFWENATTISLACARVPFGSVRRELERVFEDHLPNRHGFS